MQVERGKNAPPLMLMCSPEASGGSGFVPDKPERAETEIVGAVSSALRLTSVGFFFVLSFVFFASETVLTNT